MRHLHVFSVTLSGSRNYWIGLAVCVWWGVGLE